MKYLTYSTAVVLMFSSLAFAEKVKVDSKTSLLVERQISGPSTFMVDNSVGKIHIHEIQGSNIQIQAKYSGSSEANVVFEESAGKVKLAVEYPNSGNVGAGNGKIQIRGSGISISRIFGGSVVISGGGSVIVNGQRINPGVNGVVNIGGTGSGEVLLRLGIPSRLMAHLKAESQAGNIEVEGQFINGMEQQRQVILKSESGDIACAGVCALGEINANSQSGDIELARLRGNVSAKSMSGGIVAIENSGNLRVESMSGNIRVQGQTSGTVFAQSMSGDVTLNNPDHDVTEKASTMSGRVRGQKNSGGGNSCSKSLGGKGPFDF